LCIAGDPDELGRGIAHRQLTVDAEAGGCQLCTSAGQVRAIVAHFLGLAQVQILEVPGGKSVGDVDEEQACPGQLGQSCDVFQDGFIGLRVLNGDENVVIHSSLILRRIRRRFDTGDTR
jgi:hypothetical protein